jgi:hypothetical protein
MSASNRARSHWRCAAGRWHCVAIDIQVVRVVAYPNGDARQDTDVYGAERPPRPASQEEPSGGTEPRVSVETVAAQTERLPHALLGWCGSDDLPDAVPVSGARPTADGQRLDVPSGSVPLGGRRAGLTSHGRQVAVRSRQ